MTIKRLTASDETNKNVASLMRMVGNFAAFAAAAFVLYFAWRQRDWFRGWQPSGAMVLLTISAGMVCGMAGFLGSAAWCRLLKSCGETEIAVATCHAIYGRTQIAKYLPGNMFHFAARHALACRMGVGHAVLAAAMVCEMGGLLAVGSLLALGGIPVFASGVSGVIPPWLIWGLPIAVGIALGAFMIASRAMVRRFGVKYPMDVSRILSGLSAACGYYFIYLALVGGVLGMLLASIMGVADARQLWAAITAFSAAWVAGFLTPGAPSGFGVREATLIVLLAPLVTSPVALVAAILLRIATTLGDFLFYLVSSRIPAGRVTLR